MRRLALLLALATLLTVSSCAKYWLEGLTLPDKQPAQALITASVLSPEMSNMPNVGNVEKVLGVTFTGGQWEKVCLHFDTTLTKLGFSDDTKSMLDIMKAAGSEARGDTVMKWTRMYSNMSSPYVVMIFDMKDFFAPGAGNDKLQFPGLGAGGNYTMCVIKKK